MDLSRLQAFSDGVFAFAATLLVVEIHFPDLHNATAHAATLALLGLGRPFVSYVTSFFLIGVFWLNHHVIFKGLDDVDRPTVILNLILLIVIAFLPFPTELIAAYGTLTPIAAFYGLVQAAGGCAFFALWVYVEKRYRLSEEADAAPRAVILTRLWGLGYPAISLTGAALAFVNPTISLVVYALLPIIYLLPSAIERQVTRTPAS